MRRLLPSLLLATAVGAVLLIASPAPAQTGAKRLILKDGTYQMATQWEVKGDRVRYYSAERFEWEEVPNSMVDWDATKKWEEERKAGVESRELQEVTAEDEAERKAEEARSPVVAPGLRLPDTGGVFLLDDFHGQAQLADLEQNGGEVNKQMGKNILRAALNPFGGAKQSIELKGPKAKVQAHLSRPAIYVNIDPPDPDMDDSKGKKAAALGDTERYRIVRALPKSDRRVVGNLKIGLTGSLSQQEAFVPVNVTAMPGGWYKVMPVEPLKPGEYALVEMLNSKEMNLYVWDFGFDPNAAANGGAWRPAKASSAAPAKDEAPPLEKRK